MEEIILIGGGGHCRSCIDVIEAEGRFRIAGIVDMPEMVGSRLFGYPFIATDADLPELSRQYRNFLVTLGQVGVSETRAGLFTLLEELGAAFPTVISPRAYCSPRAEAGAGTIIMHGAVVNAGAIIGRNCILNTNAHVEHDAVIGDHCHIATGAIINGGVTVGRGSFIGSGAVTKQQSVVPPGTFIKAHSLFIK